MFEGENVQGNVLGLHAAEICPGDIPLRRLPPKRIGSGLRSRVSIGVYLLYLWWRLKKLPVDKLSNISFLQLVYVSLVYYFIMRELLFNQG